MCYIEKEGKLTCTKMMSNVQPHTAWQLLCVKAVRATPYIILYTVLYLVSYMDLNLCAYEMAVMYEMAVGNPVNIAGYVPACTEAFFRVPGWGLQLCLWAFTHSILNWFFRSIFFWRQVSISALDHLQRGEEPASFCSEQSADFLSPPVIPSQETTAGRGSRHSPPTPFCKSLLHVQPRERPLHPRCSKGWAKARQAKAPQAEAPRSSKPSKSLM